MPQFAAAFRQRDDAPEIAISALGATDGSVPAVVQHFALQVLTDTVRDRWDSVPEEPKSVVRSTALDFIRLNLKGIEEEEQYVKQRAATLVVEIAKRDWPRDWPSMADDIVAMAPESDCKLEIASLVIKMLIDESVNSDFNAELRPQRRHELIQCINSILPTIVPAFSAALQSTLHRAQQAPAGSADALAVSRVLPALTSVFAAAAEAASVPMCEELGFVDIVSPLVQFSDARIPAVEALLAMAIKKYPEPQADARNHFVQQVCAVAEYVLQQSAVDGDHVGDEALYAAQKRICACINEIGSRHLLDMMKAGATNPAVQEVRHAGMLASGTGALLTHSLMTCLSKPMH